MAGKGRRGVRLGTQVLLLQVVVVTLTLGIAGGLVALLSHQRIAAEYGTRALDVARAVAFAPAVRADVARYDNARLTPSPTLTNELRAASCSASPRRCRSGPTCCSLLSPTIRASGSSHPNRDELGKYVSTDPSEALAGHEVVRGNPARSDHRCARKFLSCAGFESSGGRGQRRHLDVRHSSAAVD